MSTAVPTCHLLALEVGDEAEGERSKDVEANGPSSDCDGHCPAIVVVKVQLVLHDRAHWLDLKRALGRQLVTHNKHQRVVSYCRVGGLGWGWAGTG